ncbi:MAG: hypothetical protein LUC93_00655 [Planctomycetaceae bacterium]|nr:hypothetical protein [Planctomycetaceae bacterium]
MKLFDVIEIMIEGVAGLFSKDDMERKFSIGLVVVAGAIVAWMLYDWLT